MTREEAIKTIESLFPADADYGPKAVVGIQLLREARDHVAGWRTESMAVLKRYATLCIAKNELHDLDLKQV